MTTEEQISDCESRLLNALKNNDILSIEELLHDNLIFNIPTGQTITKEIDIANLRSGLMTVFEIIPTDQVIKITDDVASVAVTIHLTGKFGEMNINGHFRYLRIWKLFDGKWKVIAGSGFQI